MKNHNIGYVLNCSKKIQNFFENQNYGYYPKSNNKQSSAINSGVNDGFLEEFESFLDGKEDPDEEEEVDFNKLGIYDNDFMYITDDSNHEFPKIEFKNSIVYKRIPVVDSLDDDIMQYFDDGTKFIVDALNSSQSVNCLIHCRRGKSRSVTMLIAFAIKGLNIQLSEAYQTVLTKTLKVSHVISMNNGFKRQLMKYELKVNDYNSLNFFPKRKRVDRGGYSDMQDDYMDEDDEEYQPQRKRRKLSHKRKPRGIPASKIHEEIMKSMKNIFQPKKTKQISLLDMFRKKKKKKKKKKKNVKHNYVQRSITDFFK